MYRRMIAFGGGGASFPLKATSDGLASAPAYTFASETGMGLYRAGSGQLFSVANTIRFITTTAATSQHFDSNGVMRTKSTGVIGFSSSGADTAADTGISRLAAASFAFGNGTAGDFTGALKFGNATLTAAAATAAASQISIGATTASTVGAAGGASALPATPLGYMIINVAGTAAKIPYYNN